MRINIEDAVNQLCMECHNITKELRECSVYDKERTNKCVKLLKPFITEINDWNCSFQSKNIN